MAAYWTERDDTTDEGGATLRLGGRWNRGVYMPDSRADRPSTPRRPSLVADVLRSLLDLRPD